MCSNKPYNNEIRSKEKHQIYVKTLDLRENPYEKKPLVEEKASL